MASARGFQNFFYLRSKPNGGFMGICYVTPRRAHDWHMLMPVGHRLDIRRRLLSCRVLWTLFPPFRRQTSCASSPTSRISAWPVVWYAINARVQSHPEDTLSGRLGLRAETLKGCLRQPASA